MILLLLLLILFGTLIFKTSWFLLKLAVGIIATILLVVLSFSAIFFLPLVILTIGYIVYLIFQHSQA
ncbi:hypothetical protein [Lentilactobacillus kisonensis]|uniref:Uncharacterized protein n=1 Tax=Lentilactobacillus kisonensis DSM 19906 = JCM 15041 TaxID=1423766 RepID=A0A0R1NQ34_9LACO|nr:hypothetical protein [Lentilactobacillus kisonensis]KRL22461.1 hypothetical protein FC98_GL002344 [Lentilactobacillus kisonensis DSM 19906 = JCM 15041]